MKVLFLDIDGVLNSHAYMIALPGAFDRDDWVHMLDPAPCARLARVLARTGAAVVISSSWRVGRTPEEIRELLARRAVVAEVLGATPYNPRAPIDRDARIYTAHERGYEIAAWLAEHPEVTAFAIVDDGSDMAHLRDRLVQTTWERGLLDEHVERLCALLGDAGGSE